MTTTELNLIAPLETPLPAPREGEVLTDAQWTTLLAIADTIVPSIEVSSEKSSHNLTLTSSAWTESAQNIKDRLPADANAKTTDIYFREQASSTQGFQALLQRILNEYLREDAKKGIRVLLSALNTRAGCLLMTGSTTSFHLQPVNVRQQVLQNWPHSYLSPLRDGAKAFIGIILVTWTRTSPTLSQVLGFPRAPVHGKPGHGHQYSFIQFPQSDEYETLETDVVIVGSGCGGGVAAKNLAEAGHKVIVCEKAYHWGPEHLPMSQQDSMVHLFQNAGMISSDDGSVTCIAGGAFGGGGTVNWSASLQTQAFVRKEWAEAGLPMFTSGQYQTSLDRICERMGVSTKFVEHNVNNKVLSEGARKLGYAYHDVPQNTGGKQHYCGYCTMGCGAAEKQGPVVSFLPDAERAGAQFIEGFATQKILFGSVNGKKTAIGVEGTWISRDSNGGVSGNDRTTRRVVIKAKRVIISGGTMQSPLLLLRSGLTNPHIGRNFHLHPVTFVNSYHPDRPRFDPWEGGILTTVVDEFQNLDGKGHGTKIECMTMLPSWVLPFQTWRGGLDYKDMCTKLPWITCHLSLVRDRDSGRVYPDPVSGDPRFVYTPSAFDRKHMLEGIIAGAKIAYVEGAKEIWLCHANMPVFVRPPTADDEDSEGVNNPAFQAWLDQLKKVGLPVGSTAFGTAHQMGTCRMAASPKDGVVDPTGRVWGTEGLYVADASVLPSASGVNPMVTTMALSDWISRGVAREMRQEREEIGEERAKL
ncbi:uncharacterized protein KY384_006608 [Bacidia gigantensis]|uniref:uncharacterized protein n=1 Tax=Bacidia gigantensis TaxID=2732470 RepID=UPI001D04C8F1|nr:uncharacterized protein KY384_006608 [Bacidia gigantensis]KAG8528919.1 hypothetical protein KY384_006608 [Bacidia gigantensis]